MGRLLVVTRLAARDLLRRRKAAVAVFIAVQARASIRRPVSDVLAKEG